MKVWLGKDTATDVDVWEELGHLGIFGQTRRAGKTVTLRTLATRAVGEANATVLIFRTGRNEIQFPGSNDVRPMFRPRLDWHHVEAMLWTFLAEKPKVYRPIIMRAVRGARTLEDVHRTIVEAGQASKHPWVRDRTYELDQYFQEILPWLAQHPLADRLVLRHVGVNVVNLEGWPETVQQLVISATLDYLMDDGERRHPLLVVLPEARTFVPSDRATPVKLSADRFARMGAKLNLYLWLDSQALTGVDQQLLRNFALVLQGVQSSDLEIRRLCAALDGVKPKMVRELKVGDFIVHTSEGVRTVHVPLVEVVQQEQDVDAEERKGYEDRIADLERRLANQAQSIEELTARLTAAEGRVAPPPAPSDDGPRLEHGPDDWPRPGAGAPPPPPAPAGERTRADLHVYTDTPNLTVHVKEVRLEAEGDELRAVVARMIADSYLDEKRSVGNIGREILKRGGRDYTGGSQPTLKRELVELAGMGFLTRVGNTDFVTNAEAKARVKVVKERVTARA